MTSKCGHVKDPDVSPCHASSLYTCPGHFMEVMAGVLSGAAAAVVSPSPAPFIDGLKHANAHLMGVPLWMTCAAMMNEFAVEPGEDREEAVQLLGFGAGQPRQQRPAPGGVPGYVGRVTELLEETCCAVILSDADRMDVLLGQVWDELAGPAIASYMLSLVASVNIQTNMSPRCTPEHLSAYLMLGSQVGSARVALTVPPLAEMLAGMLRDDPAMIKAGARRLDALPDDRTPAYAVVARLLGQTVDPDALVLGVGHGGDGLAFLDVEGADPGNTSPEMMMGVWAIRAARAYTTAASPDDATARIQSVARRHGDTVAFADAVTLGGLHLVASNLESHGKTMAVGGLRHPDG